MVKQIILILLLNLTIMLGYGQTHSKSANATSSSFNDFKVDSLFTGKEHSIDYNSSPTAKQFRTAITETYKEKGCNFSGHYCFVEWGCGTTCQDAAIVDLKTGKVYDAPSAALGYNFRRESRMLIVNPTDTTISGIDCPGCNQQIWILNEQTKKFEKR